MDYEDAEDSGKAGNFVLGEEFVDIEGCGCWVHPVGVEESGDVGNFGRVEEHVDIGDQVEAEGIVYVVSSDCDCELAVAEEPVGDEDLNNIENHADDPDFADAESSGYGKDSDYAVREPGDVEGLADTFLAEVILGNKVKLVEMENLGYSHDLVDAEVLGAVDHAGVVGLGNVWDFGQCDYLAAGDASLEAGGSNDKSPRSAGVEADSHVLADGVLAARDDVDSREEAPTSERHDDELQDAEAHGFDRGTLLGWVLFDSAEDHTSDSDMHNSATVHHESCLESSADGE